MPVTTNTKPIQDEFSFSLMKDLMGFYPSTNLYSVHAILTLSLYPEWEKCCAYLFEYNLPDDLVKKINTASLKYNPDIWISYTQKLLSSVDLDNFRLRDNATLQGFIKHTKLIDGNHKILPTIVILMLYMACHIPTEAYLLTYLKYLDQSNMGFQIDKKELIKYCKQMNSIHVSFISGVINIILLSRRSFFP